MAKNNKLNILICGSRHFDDKAFVWGMLNQFYTQTQGQLEAVTVSKFSGACEFAGQWVNFVNEQLPASKKIQLQECNFDDLLGKNNNSFYEDANIPDFVVQQDPFFQKGKEKLIEQGIKCVLMFPNKDGFLGASTANIYRFADLAHISCLNCKEAYDQIKQYRTQEEKENDLGNIKSVHKKQMK